MDAKIEKVLKNIENLERKWKYELTDIEDKFHSFGRIPEDKNEVGFWSVPRTTGEFLNFLVHVKKAKNVLELGCSVGYSTIFLAEAVRDNKGCMHTTELLDKKIEIATKNFQNAGLSKYITLIKKDINEVLKKWKTNSLDFVFLDADKEHYAKYYKLIIPLLKKGGILAVDNALNVTMQDGTRFKYDKMKPFVNMVKGDKKVACSLVDMDNGILIAFKK